MDIVREKFKTDLEMEIEILMEEKVIELVLTMILKTEIEEMVVIPGTEEIPMIEEMEETEEIQVKEILMIEEMERIVVMDMEMEEMERTEETTEITMVRMNQDTR